MRKIILLVIIIISSIFSVSVFAQNDNFKRIDLRENILNRKSGIELVNNFESLEKKDVSSVETNEKSPFLGALMSAVIPGSWEFYAKSYIKSAVFISAEVGLWALYAVFQKKGNNKTDEYQNYANQNWNINRYALWLKTQGFPGSTEINPNEPNFEILRQQVNLCEEQNFSHTLPAFGEQQYYEVIGKYQSFIGGWSSTEGVDINRNNYEHYVLPQIQDYMVNRQKANDYFSTASYSLDVIVINHLLSAADAAWAVTVFNKDLKVSTSFNLKNLYNVTHNQYKVTPFVNLRVSF